MSEVFDDIRSMNRGLRRLPDLPISLRLIRKTGKNVLCGLIDQRIAPVRSWPIKKQVYLTLGRLYVKYDDGRTPLLAGRDSSAVA